MAALRKEEVEELFPGCGVRVGVRVRVSVRVSLRRLGL